MRVYQLKTIPVEFFSPDHLIFVWMQVHFHRTVVGIKPGALPPGVYYRLEWTLTFFPKTPCAIIGMFSFFINNQQPIFFEQARLNEMHCQAQSCTACSSDDVFIFSDVGDN